MIYLVLVRPYKYKWYNYINIFNEALCGVIPLTILIMTKFSNDKYSVFGWLIMMEMIILFSFNFIYAIIELVIMLRNVCIKKIKETK